MGRLPATTSQAQQAQQITVRTLAKSPKIVSRFSEVLGNQDKANQFLASLISAVNGSKNLMACNPENVIGCAMVAASLNLDINANLGFASIVPYKDNRTGNQIPQFQIGWKGIVQLAIRTSQYRTMQVTEVYADEFDSYDPFKGDLKYHAVANGDRANSRTENIVGYAFYFELVSGFSKMTYMSKEAAKAHAQRFSKAYQADLKYGSQSSPWSTMFDEMAKKTIVKNTLSKWGILSTQLIMAQRADQSTTEMKDDGILGEFEYIDNNDEPETGTPEKPNTATPASDPVPTPKPDKKVEQPAPAAPAAEPEPEETAGPEAFDDAPFEEDEPPMLDGMDNDAEEAF